MARCRVRAARKAAVGFSHGAVVFSIVEVTVCTRGKGDQGFTPLADFIAKATAFVAMQSMES
ncbi:MAG: hypothetical protein ABSD59_10510 [Terracidiphilus sp.]